VAPRSSENQRLKINGSVLAGMKAPHMLVAIRDRPASPLAAIAKSPPHMAIPAEVMARVVTTTRLLRTIRSAEGIQITANNLRMVREAIGKRPHCIAVVEPVTPLSIRTRGPAPMAPLVMTTSYSTASGNYGSNTQVSYCSSGRHDNESYGTSSGGYASNTQDSSGSSSRRGNNDGGTPSSYGRAEGSSYGGDSGAGRSKYDNEPPSYPRRSGENTSSYGSEEQTAPHEHRP